MRVPAFLGPDLSQNSGVVFKVKDKVKSVTPVVN